MGREKGPTNTFLTKPNKTCITLHYAPHFSLFPFSFACVCVLLEAVNDGVQIPSKVPRAPRRRQPPPFAATQPQLQQQHKQQQQQWPPPHAIHATHAERALPDLLPAQAPHQIRIRQPVPDDVRPGRQLLLQAGGSNADRILGNRETSLLRLGLQSKLRSSSEAPLSHPPDEEAIRVQTVRAQEHAEEPEHQPSPTCLLQHRLRFLSSQHRSPLSQHPRLPRTRSQPRHASHTRPISPIPLHRHPGRRQGHPRERFLLASLPCLHP